MLAFLLLLDSPEERSDFQMLYDQYHTMAYRASYAVLKDHHLAQDATQIAFMKMAKKFHILSSDHVEDQRNYIYQLAKNTAHNLLRKEKEIVSLDETHLYEAVDERQLIEDALISIENHQETLVLLDEINPAYGEILYLKYYRELDNTEISDLLDINPNTVRVRLHRALNALKKVLEKEISFHG